MKTALTLLTLSIGLSVGNIALKAEDAAKPAAPSTPPSREEIREQLKNLTPEEREAKLKELREKFGKSADSDEARKRREEFQKLSPEEREAKMKEFRAKQGQRPGGGELAKQREELKNLPPEERAAKMKELREKMEKRHDELLKNKTEGTLTAEEQEQLNRYDAFKNRQGAVEPAKKKD